MSFPSTPSNNQTAVVNGTTFIYNSSDNAWTVVPSTPSGGAQGAQGVQGAVGAQGAQGVQGATGAQGDVGAQGYQGYQGVVGAQGDVGAQGSQGYQGAVGAQGVQGAVGAQGDVGAQGAVGAQGDVGAQGAQGYQGVIGAQGAVGAQGTVGAQGAVGAQGVQGATGAQGPQGPNANLTAGSYVLRGTNNGSIQTIPGGADTVVAFVDDFDPNGWLTSNKFQPNIAGYYSIDVSVWWEPGSVNNNQTNIQLRKNGTTQIIIDQRPIANTTIGYGQSFSTIAYFNGSTDYTEVTAYTGNPTSQNIAGAATGTWIAAALYAYGQTGPQGLTGAQGAIGAQGVQGAVGAQGAQGYQGAVGAQGAQGATGSGVAAGGNTGQVFVKNSGADYDTIWTNTLQGDFTIDGNLTISGTQFITNTTELGVQDNMIYLNEALTANISNAVGTGANVVYTTSTDHNFTLGGSIRVTGVNPSEFNLSSSNTIIALTANTFTVASNVTSSYVSGGYAYFKVASNPDLGWSGGYTDGTYAHAGVFRDATDGTFKVFYNYTPEPGDSVYIDTGHASFRIANLTANLVTNVITLRGLDPLDYANTKVSKSGDALTGDLTTSGAVRASSVVSNTSVTINTHSVLESTSITTASTSQVTLDSFATATYRSAKYLVQLTSGSAYHMIELNLIHDGTTVYLSQYGEVRSGASLGTFDASISAGTLSVLVTPTNSSTVVKAYGTLITV